MQCPYCDHPESKVTDSRPSGAGGIRRRRECERCGKRFTTHEHVDLALPAVHKRSGGQEPFDRDKLLATLRRVARGRPIAAGGGGKLIDLTRELEMELSRSKERLTSARIAELVYDKLRKLDALAADRFGASYRREDGSLEFAPGKVQRTRSPQLGLFEPATEPAEPAPASEEPPRRRAGR